ncbi:hypothetical protein [Variovorax sp.]|uniref:hypothetical protein n=1 Tax=Variovorax sp. TaxID=1871043 RepID=UPI002D78CFF6|nr:hypothetical protein [Variovorax sp.]
MGADYYQVLSQPHRALRDYLAAMRDGLARLVPGEAERPVYASAFFSRASKPEQFAALLALLHRETGVVWIVQDGLGTHRMSEPDTAEYLRAISRALPPTGWVGLLEVFDQRRGPGTGPVFAPSEDAEVERRRAIWCSSAGRLPEMTFSLNQRIAAARARRPRR